MWVGDVGDLLADTACPPLQASVAGGACGTQEEPCDRARCGGHSSCAVA
jgi:hypothetical protein